MDKRLGTLLDHVGRPKKIVEIVRLGPKQGRIREEWFMPGDAKFVETKVPRERIVEDGGEAYRRYGRSDQATYLDSSGEPAGMVKVIRAYKNKSRVQMFSGEDRYPDSGGWGPEEEVMTASLRWDGGRSWGKKPSKYDEQDARGELDGDVAAVVEPVAQDTVNAAGAATVAYMRVSSEDQNIDRQAEEIARAVGTVDRQFIDKTSASGHVERPNLTECLNFLRAGDVLVVASIDRLARSLVDLRRIVDEVVSKGAQVRFLKESLEFSAEGNDPRSDLMLGILGSFAEFERAIIRERQAEGIAAAKKRGVYKGRKPALTPAQIERAREMRESGVEVTAIARHFDVHRATIYRAIKE